MKTQYDVWLLRLVPNIANGRLICGAVILVALLTLFALAGAFTTTSVSAAVLVFFSVMLAYIVPVFHYITERTATAVRDLAPHIGDTARVEQLVAAIRKRSARYQLGSVALGLGAGLTHHLLLAGSFAHALELATRDPPNAALTLGTFAIWTVVTAAIWALVDNARTFVRLGRSIRIDLLAPRAYTPFARVAVSSTLALIGAQAAFPIMWIDPNASALATVPGLISTTVAMVFLFAMPLISIHRAIAMAKRAELSRLDELVAQAGSAMAAMEEATRLTRLSPLLTYRREIESVSEWPFDTSVAGRLALYLIIPPLTWIGAALIELLVDDLV
jgi:ABC-type multidrug transport system fused ATPase/permease subunit